MEIFNAIIPENLLKVIGWTLLHSFWQISLIAFFLWILLKLFQKKGASFQYLTGLLSLGLILFSFVATFIFTYQTFQGKAEGYGFLADSSIKVEIHSKEITSTRSAIPFYELKSTWIKQIDAILPNLVNIWFLGMVIFLFRTATNLAELRNLAQRKHQSLPASLSGKINGIMTKMGMKQIVNVYSSVHVQTPVTFGILKHVILLPSSLLLSINPGQLEAIIAHELAHIKRNDYGINLLQTFMELVFFYHPAFWWINQVVRENREFACDDLAISCGISPKDLAEGLATVLNHCQGHAPELTMAVGKKSFPTLIRIKRILGFNPKVNPVSPLISVVMILIMITCATLMVGAHERMSFEKKDIWSKTNLKLTEVAVNKRSSPSVNVYLIDSLSAGPLLQKKIKEINEKMDLPLTQEPFHKLKSKSLHNQNYPDTLPKPGIKDFPKLILSPAPDFHLKEVFQDSVWKYSKEFKDFPTDSLIIWSMEIARIQGDTSIKAMEKRKKWETKIESIHEEITVRQEEISKKIEAMTKEMEPKLKSFEEKMLQWQQENEPKLKEFQIQMEEWMKQNALKIEEMEKSLRDKLEKKSEKDL